MIEGDKVKLRSPNDSDIEFLATYRNDIILQSQLLCRAKPHNEHLVREWIEKKQHDDLLFIIEDIKSHTSCGIIELHHVNVIDGYGYMRIALLDKYQGHGYGGEAMELLETYVSEVFNMRKIILEVLNSHNHAVSAYVKQGFVKVGVLHEHFYLSDQYHDVLVMEKILKRKPG